MNRDEAARSPVSVFVIRYSLLVCALAVTTAVAQPLRFGRAARVAPFTAGTPGSDYQGGVAPRVNGFAAYWSHGGELWSESLAGSPPRPDLSTAHSLGVLADAVADTVNGPMIVYSNGSATVVRLLNAPESAATIVGIAYPDAIECNATRCLVSVDNGNMLAVVDTNAQLVQVLPPAPVAGFRVAWAADPNGFLLLRSAGSQYRATSIDNSGNVRADVDLGVFRSAAAVVFNGDRYAIFDAGITARTLTVDGQLSQAKTISVPSIFPMAVAWNGEYLLAGPASLGGGIPDVILPNALTGLRVAPDFTPIGAQPFEVAPAVGENYPTGVAWNGSTFYVVWTHAFDSLLSPPQAIGSTVEGAAVSATGDVVSRDLVSWGSIPQTWPRVAQGNQAVVVWSELDLQTGIATLRYEISGHAFTAATGYAVDVVPLGRDYLVVWTDNGRTHAATLTSDLIWTEVPLPPLDYGSVLVAANHDHWLLAGSISPNLVTVAIAHDGTASPPTVVTKGPFPFGFASDGDRFFLAAGSKNYILDAHGSPIIEKQANFAALQADFAGGVYGALSAVGTLDRYDRDGNYLGSTNYTAGRYGDPRLSHIGSRFVIVDGYTYAPLGAVVGSDGAIVVRDVHVPPVTIARTDSPVSAAVETRYPFDMWGRTSPALFVETVSIPDTPSHRAVRH